MHSISLPMKGAGIADYLLGKARENYYFGKEEKASLWHGNGAKAFGLSGEVQKSDLKNLLRGFEPKSGSPLVQNAGHKKRQTGWDSTLSVPKSLSVLWSQASEKNKQRIEREVRGAALDTLSEVEARFGITRRGKNGAISERAGLAWATFLHGTSRADDPQLHMHCILVNVGVRADGTTGTLATRELFDHKLAIGALFQAELAARLTRELGLKIEPSLVGFHVAGVPEKLCREFSKRRVEIEKLLAQRGESTAVAAKKAAIDSRPAKKDILREELFPKWRAVGESFGWGPKEAEALLNRKNVPTVNSKQRLAEGLRALHPTTTAKLSGAKLLRDAARVALTSGCGLAETLRAVERAQKRGILSIERKLLFPMAPRWSPFKKWTLPYVALNLKKHKKWGKVLYEFRIPKATVQVRQKKLFPKAPKWNPASKLELPAIKIWSDKFGAKPLKKPKYEEFDFHKEKKAITILRERTIVKTEKKVVSDTIQRKLVVGL